MTAAPVQLFAMGERGSCLQIPKNHAPRASLRPAHSANAASNVVLASTPEIHVQPMSPDKTIMDCTDYPFSTRYRFDDTLATLTCSSSTNCTSTTPCD
jgi:hypothetical protein